MGPPEKMNMSKLSAALLVQAEQARKDFQEQECASYKPKGSFGLESL